MSLPLPLCDHLNAVERRVDAACHLSLFVDFDGTLAPLADDPDDARLPPGTRDILDDISRLGSVSLSVISGRALGDVKARVGLSLIYAGNHGLEIEGPGLSYREPMAESRQARLESLSRILAGRLESLAGAAVEFKGLTTTVHFRRAAISDRPEVLRIVHEVLSPEGGSFFLRDGKQAIEILPRTGWHKGKAALWIYGRCGGSLAICLGDDSCDEDLFGGVPDAISVRVGWSPHTSAAYFVRDHEDARAFLDWLWGSLVTRDSPRISPAGGPDRKRR